MNYFGNHILTWFATGIYGVHIADLCSGYWAFSRNAITPLKLNSMRFEIEARCLVMCAQRNYVSNVYRFATVLESVKQKLGSFTDGWTIFKTTGSQAIWQSIEARTGKVILIWNRARNQI